MHRRLGHAYALAAGRDARVQVGERLGIIEPLGLRHEAFDQREHPIRAIDEAGQRGAPIRAILGTVLIEPGLSAGSVIGWRQPEQRQEVAALEMRALFLELRATLGVYKTGGGIGKLVPWIVAGGLALRLDEDRPTRSQPTQRDIEAGCDRNKLRGRRRVQIRPAEQRGPLERAVLVEDDALPDQSRPGQEVGEALAVAAVLGEVHHLSNLT